MDENEQHDSSTGLIIGMIVGGVLFVFLILAGLFGLGRAFMAPPTKEAIVVVEEGKKIAVENEAELQEITKRHEQELKIRNQAILEEETRQRYRKELLGDWQSKTPDGVLRGLRFMEERTLELAISRPGKTVERKPCKWELLDGPEGVGKGDWLLKRTASDGAA